MWSVRSVVLFEKKKRKKEKEVWEECRKLWRCASLLYIEKTCFFFLRVFFYPADLCERICSRSTLAPS